MSYAPSVSHGAPPGCPIGRAPGGPGATLPIAPARGLGDTRACARHTFLAAGLTYASGQAIDIAWITHPVALSIRWVMRHWARSRAMQGAHAEPKTPGTSMGCGMVGPLPGPPRHPRPPGNPPRRAASAAGPRHTSGPPNGFFPTLSCINGIYVLFPPGQYPIHPKFSRPTVASGRFEPLVPA